uniref:Uncharacterized protein n=1 Tax=Opuntia streptacantha TaxID=393608 RepID=A0A7C9EQH6_OPUST
MNTRNWSILPHYIEIHPFPQWKSWHQCQEVGSRLCNMFSVCTVVLVHYIIATNFSLFYHLHQMELMLPRFAHDPQCSAFGGTGMLDFTLVYNPGYLPIQSDILSSARFLCLPLVLALQAVNSP